MSQRPAETSRAHAGAHDAKLCSAKQLCASTKRFLIRRTRRTESENHFLRSEQISEVLETSYQQSSSPKRAVP